ncbi:MAG: TadE family type IV pilus minor pilin [Nocardioidaceae bacterium]
MLRAPAAVRRDQRGTVTAETVMVLPVLVSLALGLVWVVALAATQVRVVDAAREAARAAARDDGQASAVALGRRVAPDGATVTVREDGDTVVVRVRATVRGPQGLFAFLPEVEVRAEAVAAQEPG